MALTVITPQDGNIVELGTFEEKAKLFYDVSADALLIQTPGSDLVLVDRITVSNTGAVTIAAGGLTITAGGLTITAGGAVVTAGGLTVTAGGIVATAGDIDVTAGNFRAGAKSAFATTEPTSAVVLKAGTAPAGAITTSSGIFASATVLRKIIAAGTVSDVG